MTGANELGRIKSIVSIMVKKPGSQTSRRTVSQIQPISVILQALTMTQDMAGSSLVRVGIKSTSQYRSLQTDLPQAIELTQNGGFGTFLGISGSLKYGIRLSIFVLVSCRLNSKQEATGKVWSVQIKLSPPDAEIDEGFVSFNRSKQ